MEIPPKISPITKLQVSFSKEVDSLEFEQNGGDPLFFDSPSISVIMDFNDTSYPLNCTALGTLETGEKGTIALNKSGLSAMELKPGDRISVKVVDHKSGGIISKSELEVKEKTVVVPQ